MDGFFREMAQTDEILYGILGVRPLILRAPGGRIGHFTAAYAPALKAHGYVEHDWNVSSADAAPRPSRRAGFHRQHRGRDGG